MRGKKRGEEIPHLLLRGKKGEEKIRGARRKIKGRKKREGFAVVLLSGPGGEREPRRSLFHQKQTLVGQGGGNSPERTKKKRKCAVRKKEGTPEQGLGKTKKASARLGPRKRKKD